MSRDELNEAMNVGIGVQGKRCLTKTQVRLLLDALKKDEDPRVRENARVALDTAAKEGRIPDAVEAKP